MGGVDDEDLVVWAKALGLSIEHAPGCLGIALPGIAVLIDESLPAPERRRRVTRLLRRVGRERAPDRFSCRKS